MVAQWKAARETMEGVQTRSAFEVGDGRRVRWCLFFDLMLKAELFFKIFTTYC